MSEHLARLLPEVLPSQSGLQKLAIEWNTAPTSLPQHSPVLPDLQLLTNLTELTIRMRSAHNQDEYDWLALHVPSCLQKLILDAWICAFQPKLQYALCGLNDLKLLSCTVYMVDGTIRSFQALQSLSLYNTNVLLDHPDRPDMSTLTRLTHLDLTCTEFEYPEQPFLALEHFQAWPLLKVLKLAWTNLIDSSTALTVPDVAELHVQCPVGGGTPLAGSVNTEVHVHVSSSMLCNVALAPYFGRSVLSADIRLAMDIPSPSFWPVLYSCSALQSLTLADYFGGSQCISLGHVLSPLPSLQCLVVDCLELADMEFGCLVSLTSLTLRNTGVHTRFSGACFPEDLSGFTFEGSCLFDPQAAHNLQPLTRLSELSLVYHKSYGRPEEQRLSLPALPLSLKHLTLGSWPCSHCDWSVLEPCSNLERLSLPPEMERSAQLQRYVKQARQLHIVDHVFDWEECSKHPVTGLWYGTRLTPG